MTKMQSIAFSIGNGLKKTQFAEKSKIPGEVSVFWLTRQESYQPRSYQSELSENTLELSNPRELIEQIAPQYRESSREQ